MLALSHFRVGNGGRYPKKLQELNQEKCGKSKSRKIVEIYHENKGNCLDNGAMESFFGRLKIECYWQAFETLEQLGQTIHDYVHYCNNKYNREWFV